MKKSNALMLSYIIFLTVSIFANIIFDWDGLDKIAIAATIAGCFFAFGDLCNWYISYRAPLLEAIKKDFDNLMEYCKAGLNVIFSQGKELTDTIKLVTPYEDNFSSITKIINYAENLIIWNNNRETAIKECMQDCDEIQKEIKNIQKKLNRIKNIEIIFVSLGFLSFFSIISFSYILNLLVSIQTLATVVAFIVIMLNYFLRDLLEENSKKEVEQILQNLENDKKETQELLKKSHETPYLDKIKNAIAQIEIAKTYNEENDDGQA